MSSQRAVERISVFTDAYHNTQGKSLDAKFAVTHKPWCEVGILIMDYQPLRWKTP